LPKSKVKYVFVFTDLGDLRPLDGGRGRYVFYSPVNYDVEEDRQEYGGPA
jgi:hypothetical protein